MSFIQINARLKTSYYQLGVWLFMALTLCAMIAILPLTGWVQAAIVVLTIVCFWFTHIYREHLIAISSLPSRTHSMTASSTYDFIDWQLQTAQGYWRLPWSIEQPIYQAKLNSITVIGPALLLNFNIMTPMPRRLSTQLWQDQVDADSWRQLCVLARL